MNNEVKINTLFDNFNLFGLNCYEKPVYIALESLKKDSIFIHLLLKGIRNPIFEQGEHQRILERLGVCVEAELAGKENYNYKKTDTKDKGLEVYVIDLYYVKDHNSYMDFHQAHYVLVDNFDFEKNVVTVIDEDYSMNYGVPQNREGGIKYIRRTIKMDDFTTMCVNDGNVYDNETLKVYKVKIVNNLSATEFREKILNEFEEVLNRYLERFAVFEDEVNSGFKSLIEGFQDMVDHMQEDQARLWNLLDTGPFPAEVSILLIQYATIKTWEKTFSLVLKESTEKRELLDSFTNLLKTYDRIRLLLRKSIIKKNNKDIRTIKDKLLRELYTQEKELLLFMKDNYKTLIYRSLKDYQSSYR